jgi:hypothetical protein
MLKIPGQVQGIFSRLVSGRQLKCTSGRPLVSSVVFSYVNSQALLLDTSQRVTGNKVRRLSSSTIQLRWSWSTRKFSYSFSLTLPADQSTMACTNTLAFLSPLLRCCDDSGPVMYPITLTHSPSWVSVEWRVPNKRLTSTRALQLLPGGKLWSSVRVAAEISYLVTLSDST